MFSLLSEPWGSPCGVKDNSYQIHGCAALRAAEPFSFRVGINVRGDSSEQVPENGDEVTVLWGEEPVVTDFEKTLGKDVLKKPSDELRGTDGGDICGRGDLPPFPWMSGIFLQQPDTSS